jgi:uncharacterized protein YprB with RNaseH-like and TPR domain
VSSVGAPNFSRIDLLLVNFLSGVECLMSYNGARFDLPILKDQLRVDLESMFSHRDLMLDCWAHNLKGGLKNVERILGIHRDTEGIDGLAPSALARLTVEATPRPWKRFCATTGKTWKIWKRWR